MDSASRTLAGGCVCGAVRYDCIAEPTLIFNCHCEDCQHFSGAPCTTAVIVPEDDLVVEGKLTGFTTVGDNGGVVHRYFCPKCGTPVIVKPEVFSGMKALKASSLSGITATTALVCVSRETKLTGIRRNNAFCRP